MERWNTFQSSQKPVEEKIRASFKVNRFKRTLPVSTVKLENNGQLLDEIHEEFVESTVSKIRESIASVCESVKLEKLLNDLDKLVAESGDSDEKAWRPSSNVADSLAPHNALILNSFEEKLENTVLATLKSERSALNSKYNQLMTSLASNSEAIKAIHQKILEDPSDSKENVEFAPIDKPQQA